MTAALSTLDKRNAAPVGPVVGEAHGPANYCTDLGQLTENHVWLYNRLLLSLLGAPLTFDASDVDTAADTIDLPGHGLSTDDPVRIAISSGATILSVIGSPLPTTPDGLLSTQIFYAIAVDANTLSLSLTVGGAAVNISASGSGTHYVFKVPQPLHALMHRSFTHAGGGTIPANTLVATLAAYFVSTLGATLTGELVLSGASGRIVNRTISSNLPTVGNVDATLDVSTYPRWRCVDQSANHILTVSEPTKAGLETRIDRVDYTGGFAMVFKRASDASTIGRLNAVGALFLQSYDSGDGKGVTWHAAGLGGADQVT